MKRSIALLLAMVLTTGLLAGCVVENNTAYVPTGDALVYEGQDPDSVNPTEYVEPQQLELAYYSEASMNPLNSNNYTNRVLFSLIYQSLFVIDSSGNSYPMLCQNYRVSANNKTWTFYITKEATFSDGTRLTIEDVYASYAAAKSNKYYSGRFTHISSFEVTDDGGIAFYMDTPYEDLTLLLDIPIVKAEEVDAEQPLGTGPYQFANSLSGAHLLRRSDWWCDATLAATADSITLVEAESTSQIRDEFEFNDVGLVCADPFAHDYADFRGDFELWEVDGGVLLYLAVNVNYSADGIFEDSTVRSMLTYAIDRDALNEKYYHGFAQSSTLMASPSSSYYSENLASNYTYDPVLFISKISSVSKPSQKLTLLVNKDDIGRLRVARAIANSLTELGLPTETLEKDSSTYAAYIKNGDYDMYLGQTRLSANMDLSQFFSRWGNLSWNGMYSTDIYDLCLDALENHGNYYNLLKTVADDGRVIPILFSNYTVFAKRGLLSDLSPSRDNIFFYIRDWTLEDAKLATEYND